MSSIDRLRSFAESRSCPDHAIIQAGLTYGDARMLFTGIECMKAELAAAENERDAARLELRALEWMTFESPRQSFSFGFEERASGRIVWVSRAGIWPTWEFDTYASAARALGWEG